jgi:hypothetical protein
MTSTEEEETTVGEALTKEEIDDLADRWYKALDVHAPVEELYDMLLDDGNEMVWPEGPTHGHKEFNESWYQRVIRLFFDEVHTISKVDAKIDGERADVEVVVNWQAKIWNPPEPKSKFLGFDAYQTWEVVRSPETGKAVIKRYAVDKLDPMPGSTEL